MLLQMLWLHKLRERGIHMQEYIVAQNGGTEFQVLRKIGEIYLVIATCPNRDYAQQIAEALNPVPEIRTTWSELEQLAAERGR